VPKQTGDRGPVRPPAIPDRLELGWGRHPSELKHFSRCHLKSAVVYRPYVRPTKARQEVDLGRPWANPDQRNQSPPYFVVIEPYQFIEVDHSRHDRSG
jgi:hypothetical protein